MSRNLSQKVLVIARIIGSSPEGLHHNLSGRLAGTQGQR